MQVIRKIVDRKDVRMLSIPESFGEKVALIIMPAAGFREDGQPGAFEMMAHQEKTGFAQTVLADPSEDVWNDL